MHATNFQSMRKKLGKTQAELAEMLGFSLQQISNFETGRNPIPKTVALSIEHLSTCATARKTPSITYLTPKERELLQKLTEKLRQILSHQIILMIFFGSKARGDFSKESDLDILIVVKNRNSTIRHKIYDTLFSIDPDYEVKISPLIYSLQEYFENERMQSPFIKNLKHEGILL